MRNTALEDFLTSLQEPRCPLKLWFKHLDQVLKPHQSLPPCPTALRTKFQIFNMPFRALQDLSWMPSSLIQRVSGLLQNPFPRNGFLCPADKSRHPCHDSSHPVLFHTGTAAWNHLLVSVIIIQSSLSDSEKPGARPALSSTGHILPGT